MVNLLIEEPYGFILLAKQSHGALLSGGLPLTLLNIPRFVTKPHMWNTSLVRWTCGSSVCYMMLGTYVSLAHIVRVLVDVSC